MNAVPSCENCRFYRPGRYVRTGQCMRYIVYRGRGKIIYEWSDSVRFSENKCGATGKLFVALEKNKSRDRHEIFTDLLNDEE
jgi:hypothetical protein